jgi:hypothetical protein
MSSILKALKKLEQEKARRADSPVDIARDILRTPVRRKKIALLPILVLFAGIFVLAGLSGYLFHGREDAQMASEIAPAGNLASPAVPGEPALSAPEKKALPSPQGLVEPPVVEKTMDNRVPAAADQQFQERSSVRQPIPAEKGQAVSTLKRGGSTPTPTPAHGLRNPGEDLAARRSMETSGQRAIPAGPPPGIPSSPDTAVATLNAKPPAVVKTEPPAAAMVRNPVLAGEHKGLVVSGIAFQGDRAARIAVVNDLPVMEGSLVEGARVEEILSDRVKFSRDGKMFEVPLQER